MTRQQLTARPYTVLRVHLASTMPRATRTSPSSLCEGCAAALRLPLAVLVAGAAALSPAYPALTISRHPHSFASIHKIARSCVRSALSAPGRRRAACSGQLAVEQVKSTNGDFGTVTA